MKIIVLGAGGIGSLVGGLLSKQEDVVLVGRKSHIDEINKNGLQINGCINENIKVKAIEEIESIDEDELIVLSTKATNNKESLEKIKNLIGENNTIICLQNGLGNEEEIRKIVNCKVVRAIITAGTTFLEPGKVKCSNLGSIFLEKSGVSEQFDEMLNKAGIKAEVVSDIKDRLWKKLIVNCAMNTLTAIFKVKNSGLEKCPDLIRSIIHEQVLVANKEGLNYNEEEVYVNVIKIINDSAENQSSMLQDMIKGRKTEIDYLNGAVVQLGRKYGIKCPVNDTLVRIIKAMENSS